MCRIDEYTTPIPCVGNIHSLLIIATLQIYTYVQAFIFSPFSLLRGSPVHSGYSASCEAMNYPSHKSKAIEKQIFKDPLCVFKVWYQSPLCLQRVTQ